MKNGRNIAKVHRSQLARHATGQTWNDLSIRMNDSNELMPTE
jgi:hypothetical protein